MRKIIMSFLLLGLMTLQLAVSDVSAQTSASKISYDLWANVLQAHVDDNGLVNYDALLQNRAEFDQFMDMIENANIDQLSDEEKKAFWINAYNAITLDVVLDKYPVKSIRRINFGLVWEVPRKVAQTKHSLGHIEHKILRPMGDPRVHFAINCASIGCPKLPNKPFYPGTLDEQLDHEAKRFINDPEKVKLNREENILYHSAILKWFEEDFLVVSPDITSYIEKYINADDQEYLNTHQVKVKATKYDWGLNKQ